MSDSEVLFVTDKDGRKTHALVPVDTYNALMQLKGLLRHTATLSDNELYTYQVKNVTARGYPQGQRHKPRFVVTKDSQVTLYCANTLPQYIVDLKDKLIDNGIIILDPVHNCFVFTKDYEFESVSRAASLIAGTLRPGLDVFVNREGFSLKDSGYGHKAKKSKTGK